MPVLIRLMRRRELNHRSFFFPIGHLLLLEPYFLLTTNGFYSLTFLREPNEVKTLRALFSRLATFTGGSKLIDMVLALSMQDLISFCEKVCSLLSYYPKQRLCKAHASQYCCLLYALFQAHMSAYMHVSLTVTCIYALTRTSKNFSSHKDGYMRTIACDSTHICIIKDVI